MRIAADWVVRLLPVGKLMLSLEKILDRRDDWLNGRISDAQWGHDSQILQQQHLELGKKQLTSWADDVVGIGPIMTVGNHLAGPGGDGLDIIKNLSDALVNSLPNPPTQVQIQVGINPASGLLTATFRSIDPVTSLPPEDGTGRGQGHVSFSINARAGCPPARRCAMWH